VYQEHSSWCRVLQQERGSMAVVPVEHAGTGWNSGKEDEGTREVMPARGARGWLGFSNKQRPTRRECRGLAGTLEQTTRPTRRECRGLAGTLERATRPPPSRVPGTGWDSRTSNTTSPIESAGDWLGLSNEQYDLPHRECRGLAGTLERAI
jgi:hypothetical protein